MRLFLRVNARNLSIGMHSKTYELYKPSKDGMRNSYRLATFAKEEGIPSSGLPRKILQAPRHKYAAEQASGLFRSTS